MSYNNLSGCACACVHDYFTHSIQYRTVWARMDSVRELVGFQLRVGN